jgi:hypothetical protein
LVKKIVTIKHIVVPPKLMRFYWKTIW